MRVDVATQKSDQKITQDNFQIHNLVDLHLALL
jgi:hypothetical protein